MRPALTELRLRRAARPLTERWRQLPVQPRGAAKLGISFRPLQATALGLDPDTALQALLAYPFQVIRLSAYWNRLEPHQGDFRRLSWTASWTPRSRRASRSSWASAR